MIDGEASKIINDAQAGFTCPSESPEMLAKNIERISLMKKIDLYKLGENVLDYYKKYFNR